MPKIPEKRQLEDLGNLYSIFVEQIGHAQDQSGTTLVKNLAVSVFALEIFKRSRLNRVDAISAIVNAARQRWPELMNWGKDTVQKYRTTSWSLKLEKEVTRFDENAWLTSNSFPNDVKRFLKEVDEGKLIRENEEPPLPL
ncbi:hypothetical protein [Sphingomonas bacterium]|uniref:hypothetical protein n=1 Tax=Sphingomonas bacterium TaxID=1895847 RepID=UPI002629B366|nr:hypothetical protein [Sphingomonas bacterium]